MLLAKRPAESQEDYAAFLAWALQSPPRPAPVGRASVEFAWVERAAALERCEPEDLLRLAAQVEAQKTLTQALLNNAPGGTLDPRALIALVTFLRDVPAQRPAADLSRLTTDELHQLEALHAKARGEKTGT